MALRDDGAVAGSVSGGCIEEDLAQRARHACHSSGLPEIVTYGVTPAEAARFGLPCGGTVRVVVEPAPDAAMLRELAARLAKRELVARELDTATGLAVLDTAVPDERMKFYGTRLRTIHGPQWQLLIIGAGQASQYLAQMAAALDYQIFICDPRSEYRETWSVEGTTVVSAMPDDAVIGLGLDSRSAVVALTHDPKLDDLALIEALRSPAFYVGCLGSRLNTARRKERLHQHFDLSDRELARLHAPVGLAIGSRTPPEIAVSILAEMTALKNGRHARDARRAEQPEMHKTACGAQKDEASD